MRSSSAITPRSQAARGGTFDAERGFHRAREGEGVGNGAVARGAAGEARRLLERRAMHQCVDALVHVAQALLQPHHGLAIGGEAEMARLDDAGVHRTDRNLVQALAFHRQERIGGRIRHRDRARGACRASPTGSRPNRSRIARSSRIAGACTAPTDG